MRKLTLPIVTLCLMLLSSCAAIEGIFKVGLYAGIFIVVAILLVIFFIYRKLR